MDGRVQQLGKWAVRALGLIALTAASWAALRLYMAVTIAIVRAIHPDW